MRTSKEILERINGTYQYFKEAEDTSDERYNKEKNMWKDLFVKFYEGLESANYSDLDVGHYTDAFRFVMDSRNEKLGEIFENRCNEAQDKLDSDEVEMETAVEIMKAELDVLKDTKNYMEYFGLEHAVLRASMRLVDDAPLKAFVNIVKNHDENDKDKDIELSASIYTGQSGEYAYLDKYNCSKKGALLLEEKIGSLPEFDELFGRK